MKKRVYIRPFSAAGFAICAVAAIAALELMRGLAWVLWAIM